MADQISDAVLDNLLAFDPQSKVACETLVTTGQVVVAGEVRSDAYRRSCETPSQESATPKQPINSKPKVVASSVPSTNKALISIEAWTAKTMQTPSHKGQGTKA